MQDQEHWLTRWLAAPYQAMLRSLGQSPTPSQAYGPDDQPTVAVATVSVTVPELLNPTRSAASVALLIDGENCTPEVAAHALRKASEFGTVRVRRVYANWSVASTRGWIDPIARYAIQPIHHEPTSTGKNATDILLTIDAMDLLHTHGIDCFCLVTSDSDYTPLVVRLRAAQCSVVVIGRAKTVPTLIEASNLFVRLEDLLGGSSAVPPTDAAPQATSPTADPPAKPMTMSEAPAKATKAASPPAGPAAAAKPTKAVPPPASPTAAAKPAKAVPPPASPAAAAKPAKAASPPASPAAAAKATKAVPSSAGSATTAKSAQPADLGPLLIAVWESVRQTRGAVSLSDFVNAIKQQHPQLDPQCYGHTRLAQLVKTRPDLFTLKPNPNAPAQIHVLRTAPVAVGGDQQELRTLLKAALQVAPSQDGWIYIGVLGSQLKQIAPSFTPKKYGYSRLGLLLQAYPEICELRVHRDGGFDVRLRR
ncbi:MAG: NYN domain-containing protein [Oscillochloridaceae bacterium umkhey_bin13]